MVGVLRCGREDAALAAGMAPAAACALHRELASGAESGWDFSSRWCAPMHITYGNLTRPCNRSA